jgi:hypothetical protein
MKIVVYNFSDFQSGIDVARLNFEVDQSQIRVSRKSTNMDSGAQTITFEFWSDLIEELLPIAQKTDKQLLDDIVAAHSGKPFISPYIMLAEPKDNQGLLRVTAEPRSIGIPYANASHNLCDRTTWYYQSEPMTGVVLSTSDNIHFTSGYQNWIDLVNGKVLREEIISQELGTPNITVDGVVQQVRTIDEDGYCVIDYANGVVTFDQPVAAGAVVKADFRVAKGSSWYVMPGPGTSIRIEAAEVQFTSDITFSTFNLEVLTNVNEYGVGDIKNDIKVMYRTLYQLIDEVKGCYPQVQVMGGENGISHTMSGFPLRFGDSILLNYSTSDMLVISLKDDKPFTGTRATVTFYGTEMAV